MFKDWIKDLWNLSMDTSGDVNIDIARANYQKYQGELRQQQKDYIKTLCSRIKFKSRDGWKYVDTEDLPGCLNTNEFRIEMKEYFEQRGFHVEEKTSTYGLIRSWLKIRWDEGDK